MLRCQPFQERLHEGELLRAPYRDSAIEKRALRVRDEEVRSKLHVHPQPVAGRAGPLRTIERKQTWRQLRATRTTVRAGEALTKHEMLTVDELYANDTFRVGECCLNRIGQTGGHVWSYNQTIDDDFNGVVQ